MSPIHDELVAQAKAGNRTALTTLVQGMQPGLFALCVRMLWHRQDAEDACQEILVKLVTRLATFRGDSRITTWAYRVAIRHLLDFRRSRAECSTATFEAFSDDLLAGQQEPTRSLRQQPDYNLLLHEVKTGCSLAMLLCLDRSHRASYILGEILEFDHREAARVLGIPAATFRKRLERARTRVQDFTRRSCGLVAPAAPCRCARRISAAITLGRVTPGALHHATAETAGIAFTEVERTIGELEAGRRAVALFRSQSIPVSSPDFARTLAEILEHTDRRAN
ncbi:MAG: RNA polymerase sigma factor [Opitutae bacterium]|nr:RNA polymerase sigma factor [Opitutae bacterium]